MSPLEIRGKEIQPGREPILEGEEKLTAGSVQGVEAGVAAKIAAIMGSSSAVISQVVMDVDVDPLIIMVTTTEMIIIATMPGIVVIVREVDEGTERVPKTDRPIEMGGGTGTGEGELIINALVHVSVLY